MRLWTSVKSTWSTDYWYTQTKSLIIKKIGDDEKCSLRLGVCRGVVWVGDSLEARFTMRSNPFASASTHYSGLLSPNRQLTSEDMIFLGKKVHRGEGTPYTGSEVRNLRNSEMKVPLFLA